jgi:hypothetical protein
MTGGNSSSIYPPFRISAKIDFSYRNPSELQNMVMMDEAQGEAYLQIHPRSRWDCFILDFDSTSLTAKSFTQGSHKEEDLFCAALRGVPNAVETRIILFNRPTFLAILSLKVVETLG